MEIKSSVKGFLEDAAYFSELEITLSKYNGLFGNAEKLTVNLSEKPPGVVQKHFTNPMKISPDGKEIIVNITFQQFAKGGKIIKTPSPKEVYEQMQNVLNNAVMDYLVQYPNEQ